MVLNVIHIFAYGESQIISDTLNFKTASSAFTKLAAVIADVKSKKPVDVPVQDYHAINIFGNSRVSYISKEKTGGFDCKYSDLNPTLLTALIAEFQALNDAAPKK